MENIDKEVHPFGPYKTPIHVKYFNRQNGSIAWASDHWGEGICFHTTTRFPLGATVQIQACRDKATGFFSAPPSPTNTLGVVKGCKKISGAVPTLYEVNVRYFLSEC